jgi:single-strand DNA-binding protein
MNINKVSLAGRLTRDPEVRFTPTGLAVADITLATSRFFKDQSGGDMKEEVAFIDVSAFGRTAEMIQKHLRKASPIYLEGHLKLEQWDDKQTGAKRSKLKVVAESMQFVGPKPQSATTGEPTPSPALHAQRAQRSGGQAAPPAAARPKPGVNEDGEPEDIPF